MFVVFFVEGLKCSLILTGCKPHCLTVLKHAARCLSVFFFFLQKLYFCMCSTITACPQQCHFASVLVWERKKSLDKKKFRSTEEFWCWRLKWLKMTENMNTHETIIITDTRKRQELGTIMVIKDKLWCELVVSELLMLANNW